MKRSSQLTSTYIEWDDLRRDAGLFITIISAMPTITLTMLQLEIGNDVAILKQVFVRVLEYSVVTRFRSLENSFIYAAKIIEVLTIKSQHLIRYKSKY